MTAKPPSSSSCASSVLPWDSSCAQKLEGGKESLADKTQVWRFFLAGMQCLCWAVWPHAPCQWKPANKSSPEEWLRVSGILLASFPSIIASCRKPARSLFSQWLMCELGIDSNSNFLIHEHGDCWDKVKAIHSWESFQGFWKYLYAIRKCQVSPSQLDIQAEQMESIQKLFKFWSLWRFLIFYKTQLKLQHDTFASDFGLFLMSYFKILFLPHKDLWVW